MKISTFSEHFPVEKSKTLAQQSSLDFQWNSMELVPEDAQRYSTLQSFKKPTDFWKGFRENQENVPENSL